MGGFPVSAVIAKIRYRVRKPEWSDAGGHANRHCVGQAPVQAPGEPVSAIRNPTERFSSRVENYVRYRPSYPPAAIELLKSRCGLRSGARVADLGSGTGILTQLLLEAGAEVLAVEPNEPMRAAAEARLGAEARFHSVAGTAEATALAASSVELLV